jgi:hypothetical protein
MNTTILEGIKAKARANIKTAKKPLAVLLKAWNYFVSLSG